MLCTIQYFICGFNRFVGPERGLSGEGATKRFVIYGRVKFLSFSTGGIRKVIALEQSNMKYGSFQIFSKLLPFCLLEHKIP